MGSYFSTPSNQDDDWTSDARLAMESGTFCVICGGPFNLEGDIYNLNPKEARYQWLYKCRLLGFLEDVDYHLLGLADDSQPINTSETDGIFLSGSCHFDVTISPCFRVPSNPGLRRSDVLVEPLFYEPKRNTLFPLHDACIETSLRVIEHEFGQKQKYKEALPLPMLCKLLNANWHDNHSHDENGHDPASKDIFNLCDYNDLYGPRSVLAMNKLEWWGGEHDRFYSNPVEAPERLSKFVFQLLLASSSSGEQSQQPSKVTRDPVRLERLPTEILDSICSYIPAGSVISLHSASKILAINVPLDNAFWRDCLRNGRLHPYIWDLDTSRIEELHRKANAASSADDWDWRTVAKSLAMEHFLVSGRDPKLGDLPLGLWNRCRIWTIVQEALQDCYAFRLR